MFAISVKDNTKSLMLLRQHAGCPNNEGRANAIRPAGHHPCNQ